MLEISSLLEHNQLFSVTLAIVFIIGIMEGLLSLVGVGMSAMLDSFMPELDINVDMPDTQISTFSEIFGWINKGRVPMLMLVLTFMTFFGLIGLNIQSVWFHFTGHYIYTVIVAVISFILAMPFVSYFSLVLSKVMPRDETTAISTKTFIGETCTIINEAATDHKFVEAKFKDLFGEVHYIMVKSADKGVVFHRGAKGLIVSQINDKKFLISSNVSSN